MKRQEHGQVAVGAFEAARAMTDQAIMTLRVYLPLEALSIDGDRYTTTIYAYETPMFESKQNLLDLEVTVSGEWLNWPPPLLRVD
jgi:hypothetical protein